MAVTLSSSTKQPAKPKISHWSFRRRLSASLRRAKCAPTKNMSGRRGDTDSPHCGGQAVAGAGKNPRPGRAGRMAGLLIFLALSALLKGLFMHGNVGGTAPSQKH